MSKQAKLWVGLPLLTVAIVIAALFPAALGYLTAIVLIVGLLALFVAAVIWVLARLIGFRLPWSRGRTPQD